jgi:hypothetical protein
MKTSLISLAVLLVICRIAWGGDGSAPKDQPARFKITTKRKDDSVEVRPGKGKVVFIVKSPFGISQAVIQREGKKWPQAVVLRLRLKGLERFRASNGKVTVSAAVSMDKGKAKVRLWKGRKEDAPWTRKAPSGWVSASSEATVNRPRRFRSRAGTSRLHCPKRSLRATPSRSR